MTHITPSQARAKLSNSSHRGSGRALFFTDAPRRGYVWRDEDAHVPSAWHGQDDKADAPGGSPSRNSNPDTTTIGAGSPPGMMQKLVVALPLEGKFAYWPQTTPDGMVIYRRDMQSKSGSERVGGPYVPGPGGYLWFDVTTTMWRLWQAINQQAILNDDMSTLRTGRAHSADGALGVSSRTWESGGKNNDTGEGDEVTGVDAVSWVGGHKNTTGYRINAANIRASLGRLGARQTSDVQNHPLQSVLDRLTVRLMGKQTNSVETTSDAARPGLAIGRSNAKLVARRVSTLEQINATNKQAWQRS